MNEATINRRSNRATRKTFQNNIRIHKYGTLEYNHFQPYLLNALIHPLPFKYGHIICSQYF